MEEWGKIKNELNKIENPYIFFFEQYETFEINDFLNDSNEKIKIKKIKIELFVEEDKNE